MIENSESENVEQDSEDLEGSDEEVINRKNIP